MTYFLKPSKVVVKTHNKMVSKLPEEFRSYQQNCHRLQKIFKETQHTLNVISHENLFPDENIMDELLPSLTLDRLTHILSSHPAIVVSGQDCKSKATLVNRLLGTDILPLADAGNWRWIKFSYGRINHVSVTLGLEYEVVECVQTNDKTWETIPVEDLHRSDNEDVNCPTILDVKLDKSVLKEGVQIFVVPDIAAIRTLAKGVLRILPIFLYALSNYPLSEENTEELRELKETYPYTPVLFASILTEVFSDSIDGDLTESEQHRLQSQAKEKEMKNSTLDPNEKDDLYLEKMNSLGVSWLDQLDGLGFLRSNNLNNDQMPWLSDSEYVTSNDFVESYKKIDRILPFVRGCFRTYLVNASNYLNGIQTSALRKFILSAYDMAREIQITPKRIQYVQEKENELYTSLMNVVSQKQDELTELIRIIIQEMKNDLSSTDDDEYQCQNVSNAQEGPDNSSTINAASAEVQRQVLLQLSEKVARELVTSVNCLRETFVGTLQRCLLELEKSYDHDYNLLASDALNQILSAAYNVELHNSSPSLIHSFLERLRQVFKNLSKTLLWSPTPPLDAAWRKRVTLDVLNSLAPARLARTISTQFRDKIKSSHDSFHAALRSLENHYSGKLERTEEQKVAIRKIHAPQLAKLALVSTSMSDYVRFGMPHQGREIGRGQYGVVFACDGWAGAPGRCAVKSVVPPDDRHWNDLAMEFYYTRSIPDHKRIVKLRGSIIDYTYGGGHGVGAAVLLITDRMSRDLYCGLRDGLSWIVRIQIAIDVLEGIRYLHRQGLLHRDIKLKNVLLDEENRAKLTDLGFCITEAMMSGSIVGTPVHMAPELLSGHYDSSVDVYAFGILFWYICAGHTKMPEAFEHFYKKEQLWISVRKGLRPERLSSFDDECWQLMEQCWAGEPSKRPLLGAILPVLGAIRDKVDLGKSLAEPDANKQQGSSSSSYETMKNPALALAEPNNQRGTTPSPHLRRRPYRALKYPTLHLTNLFQASVCSNLYIQMREF